MNRRDFLKLGGLTLLGSSFPTLLSAGTGKQNILLLIELKGGNDGLNTLIPYSDSNYYRLRPNLAISRDKVLPLTTHLGLNGVMKPLMESWGARDLAIVQGLGYPDPNRSHSRSIEIWETASNSNEYLHSGWLNQVIQPSGNTTDAVVLGRNSGVVSGGGLRSIVLDRPEQFLRRAKRLPGEQGSSFNPALNHILRVRSGVKQAASELELRLQSISKGNGYPKSRFGRNLELAGRLVRSGADMQVIKLSLGSFDTHAGQLGKHNRLLTTLANGLAAFRKEMIATGNWDRVLLMTYSEFGRRAAENGSRGTDHGTAAPHFVIGGKVNGGLFGQTPSLSNLDKGDLRFTTDFRSLYTTVGNSWFGSGSTGFQHQGPRIIKGLIKD